MLVGNSIALVIYGFLVAQILENYFLAGIVTNDAVMLIVEILIAACLILITGEFLPKILFKINPEVMLRVCALPAYFCYLILYPVSRLSARLSAGVLQLVGVRVDREHSEKAFTKIDLDYLIQSSIDNSANDDEIDPEIKIFQNVLDFRMSKYAIAWFLVPRLLRLIWMWN